MNLYLLKNLARTSYDDLVAAVVRAENESHARLLLFDRKEIWEDGTVHRLSYEDPTIWLDPERSSCELLTDEGKAGVIVADVIES